MLAIPEDNDIDRFSLSLNTFDFWLNVVSHEDKRLTLCGSEDKSSESIDVLLIDDTSNVLNVYRSLANETLIFTLVDTTSKTIFTVTWLIDSSSELPLKLWDHLLSNLVYLKAVFQILERLQSLFHLNILLLDELLFTVDVVDNLIEKKVNGFLLLFLDLVELVNKALDVVWWSNFDVVFLALIEQVGKFPLSVFTELDLWGIFQVVWRGIFVQINEVSIANVSELKHHIPSVINWHSQLIQTHDL